MLKNLHALRGLAALSVVFYHLNIHLPNGVHTDFNAVAAFFVISGYLMRLTSDRDRRLFMTKRLLRVVPTLWVVTALVVIYQGAGFMNPPYTFPLIPKLGIPFLSSNMIAFVTQNFADNLAQSPSVSTNIALHSADRRYVDADHRDDVLHRLRIALFVSPKRASALAALVLLSVSLAPILIGYSRAEIIGIASYQPYFCVGLFLSYGKRFVSRMVRTVPRRSSIGLIVVALVGYLAACATDVYLSIPAFAGTREAFNLVLVSLPVIATMMADAIESPVAWPLMVLGDISFSLYLIHAPVIETFRPVWAIYPALAPQTWFGATFLVAMSLLAGLLVYRLVERPLTLMQHALIRRLGSGRIISSPHPD